MHLSHLQLNDFSFDVAPTAFIVISFTEYMPPSVRLKLQLTSDWVRLEHSFNIWVGPLTSIIMVSMGGVYFVGKAVAY